MAKSLIEILSNSVCGPRSDQVTHRPIKLFSLLQCHQITASENGYQSTITTESKKIEWKTNEESISQLQWCSHRLPGRTSERTKRAKPWCVFYVCFFVLFLLLLLLIFFFVCVRLNTHYNHIYRWIPLFGLKKSRSYTYTRTHEAWAHGSQFMHAKLSRYILSYITWLYVRECGGCTAAAVARSTWYTYLYNVNVDIFILSWVFSRTTSDKHQPHVVDYMDACMFPL